MSQNPFHIIFCGTSEFAVPALELLSKDPAFVIDLVVTQPDRPVGRKQILTPSPVKFVAQGLGLTVYQPEKLNAEFFSSAYADMRPDFLVVVSYGQILSSKILALPKISPVNVHPSLLPRWRGASPLQHALLHGDTETGVTVQVMAKEMDAGPILMQEKSAVEPRETYQHLHDRLAQVGARMLKDTLLHPLAPKEQSSEGITICSKLTREDGACDASTMTAEEIDRRVRALTPWPGVTLTMDGIAVKILKTALSAEPGSIPVACKSGSTLFVEQILEPGKKPMSGEEWKRGH